MRSDRIERVDGQVDESIPERVGKRAVKARKAESMTGCERLEQLPNVGPSMAADLRRLGIVQPGDLRGLDAFVLYQRLCTLTGSRQDPCVLDTFMAVIDFADGAPAAPWWHYTPERKRRFGQILAHAQTPVAPAA